MFIAYIKICWKLIRSVHNPKHPLVEKRPICEFSELNKETKSRPEKDACCTLFHPKIERNKCTRQLFAAATSSSWFCRHECVSCAKTCIPSPWNYVYLVNWHTINLQAKCEYMFVCFFLSVNSFVHTKLRMAINTSRCKQRFLNVKRILLCCLVFFLFDTLGDTIWNRNQILAPPLANKTVYFTSLYLNFFLFTLFVLNFYCFFYNEYS